MKIQKGDKYVCKKDDYDGLGVGVHVNKTYEVVEVQEVPAELSGVLQLAPQYVIFNGGDVYNYTFCVFDDGRTPYIWDYFYKPNELRKKKLENINEKDKN